MNTFIFYLLPSGMAQWKPCLSEALFILTPGEE
jgi:hypothetical protein